MNSIDQAKIPVTMLSGFLGSGKTTLLRYLLENSTKRIACIVNDVASINIDAKLIRGDINKQQNQGIKTTSDLTDTIELMNGCACCSVKDELFASFSQIIVLMKKNGKPYDRIILENSGVAEPRNIRESFDEATLMGLPILNYIYLQHMITIVDGAQFAQEYQSRHPIALRPDLGDGGDLRPVVDLLVEQVEFADLIVLNKIDLLPNQSQTEQLMALLSTLNSLANVVAAQQGKIDLDLIIGQQIQPLMVNVDVEGQHRSAVVTAKQQQLQQQQQQQQKNAKEQHQQLQQSIINNIGEKDINNLLTPQHNGSINQKLEDSHHVYQEDQSNLEYSHNDKIQSTRDSQHNHGHYNQDEQKNQQKHDIQHQQAHQHRHDHDHNHERQSTTAAKRFGINTFVYQRRKPFHSVRFKEIINLWLPSAYSEGYSFGLNPNERQQQQGQPQQNNQEMPLRQVLRSKGYIWLTTSNTTTFYWSHAGAHFEVIDEGDWWASIPKAEWPQAEQQRSMIMQDFDQNSVYGDRRQEIVFIGISMNQDKITKLLDSALVTDDELQVYNKAYGVQT